MNPPNSQFGKPMSLLYYLQWYRCESLVTGVQMTQRYYQRLKLDWEVTHKAISLELPVQLASSQVVGESPPELVGCCSHNLEEGSSDHLRVSFHWLVAYFQSFLRGGSVPRKLPHNKWVRSFYLRGREVCERVVVVVMIQKYEFQHVTTLEVVRPETMVLINEGTKVPCNIQLYSEP